MTAKRILLAVLAASLAMVAFVGLAPFTALPLISRLLGYYPVGIGMDAKAQMMFAAAGGAAAVGSAWALTSGIGVRR